MKWLWGALGIFSCMICGLLGLTAGINLNPQSTIKFVPEWGSLADWVSGIGATCAVVATVYFGWKQREELLPKLSIKTTGIVLFDAGESISSFAIKLANTGSMPIDWTGICFHSDHGDKALWIDAGLLLPGSAPIAGSLAPGKATSIMFSRRTLVLLRAFIDEHCEGRFKGLKVTINGAIKDFTSDVDPSIPRIA